MVPFLYEPVVIYVWNIIEFYTRTLWLKIYGNDKCFAQWNHICITSVPIGAWTCSFPAILGNYDRPIDATDTSTNQPADGQEGSQGSFWQINEKLYLSKLWELVLVQGGQLRVKFGEEKFPLVLLRGGQAVQLRLRHHNALPSSDKDVPILCMSSKFL